MPHIELRFDGFSPNVRQRVNNRFYQQKCSFFENFGLFKTDRFPSSVFEPIHIQTFDFFAFVAPNFSLSPPKVNRARIQYKTTYACEHRELMLKCEPNESIHLVRANYGRFSLSICNDGGRLDLSVMCMSYRSFLIMTDRCSNKSSCSVVVSSKLFGDPCPGTAKYLEVQYHCVRGGASSSSSLSSLVSSTLTQRPPELSNNSNTTGTENSHIQSPVPTTTFTPEGVKSYETTSPPPNQIPFAPLSNANANLSSNEANSFPNLAEKSQPTPFSVPLSMSSSTSSPTTTVIHSYPVEDVIDNYSSPKVQSQPSYETGNFDSQFMPIPVEDFCPKVFMRSLFWNWTRVGQISTLKCPGGAIGIVKWQCNYNPEVELAEWYPIRPDFSECRSLWLDNLEERLSNGEPVIRIAHELALMTLTKPLYSEDLQRISRFIQSSFGHAVSSIQNLQLVESWHRHKMLKELLVFVIETISNLLGNAQDDAWLDLSISVRKEVASSLIKSLENTALLLAENTNHDGSTAIAKPNVLVSVHVLDTRMPISLQFPTLDDTSGTNEWIRMEDSIFLPAQALVDHSQNGMAKVAFFAYYRIEDLLKPSQQTDIEGFNSFLVSRLQNLSQSLHLSINSRVIGAAISHNDQTSYASLSTPVTIVLRHIQDENIFSPQCVFWSIERQNWLTDGCWVETTNSTHTICMCNHLTHFALLSEVKPPTEPHTGYESNKVIVFAGCILALLILAFVSILIFTTPTGSTVSSSIHRNLCLTLFASEMIYLIIFSWSLPPTTVVFIGLIFLHYFLICSFFWTFFESFDIYMNTNSIYEHYKSSKRLYWYYVIAFISPAFICVACFVINSNFYHNINNFWLKSDNYLYLALIGPIAGLTLASLILLFFAYVLTRNNVITTTTIKCFEDIRAGVGYSGRESGLKSLIRWVLLLLIQQFFIWGAAFTYLRMQQSISLSIVFAICKVAFALFICVFCILNIENVQHSRLLRNFPMHLCQNDSQLSNVVKNSTSSDVYSTRPVVTQVTSTQVNGISAHIPIGHSPSTPTAISPASMSSCLPPQTLPLPISQSTHWNIPQGMAKTSITQDHQSILAAPEQPNCLLYSLTPVSQLPYTKTLPRELLNSSYIQESYVDSNLRNLERALAKKRGKNIGVQGNFEFSSLHRGNLSRKPFGVHPNENKYTVQGTHSQPGFVGPKLDHIYESIDSDSISSNMYDRRAINMHHFYATNDQRSKSTVNDDDLSSSSIYEDKPLLFANNSSSISDNKSTRIFIPHHYHSNASIYDKAPKDREPTAKEQRDPVIVGDEVLPNAQANSLWQFVKDSPELPDLLQKSNCGNNLLVSYSGENRFLNKLVIPKPK